MFDENTGNGIEDLTEVSMFGDELTDSDLLQVAGGQRVIDIKSYEDGVYVDHEIFIVD